MFETPNILLKDLRSDWKLKSTFFCIDRVGNNIILNGKGNGHGVGLCQEGAIRMAETGYSFRDILNFYYKDVKLINISTLRTLLE